ncbi:TetR family transcriptional regulator [Nocardioides limicola]|uniref:TetR family transcriptional regulator n=1 Tax=Nocardioides limicola TaxID=2803368 RepID=UPI00193B351A|nr:TetR family transcriptional regulator [Nocardioides sp. DJM-14]
MEMSRAERKEHTRRAILDSALALSEESSLVGLSLRQVAKEVGVVPTAFYRHFDSLDALGLALVEESFGSLRHLLADARRLPPDTSPGNLLRVIVDASVAALTEQVPRQASHFRFIARERVAGPTTVRAAVRHEIELIERELATDLARLPGAERWSSEDLRILTNLLVTAMISHAEALAAATRPEERRRIGDVARRQLKMVFVGALQWQS